MSPSVRAQVVTRRTYNRPLDNQGSRFETWEETVDRVIGHQRWLWERALDRKLTSDEAHELEELRQLFLERKALPSGRSLWLGGTDIAKRRESSMFNCSFSQVKTVYDVVDHLWLLLQGCGVGSMAQPGVLNGFAKPVKSIEVIRSKITKEEFESGQRGRETNDERFYKRGDDLVWHLQVGDSAEAWAKALGKILAMKRPVDVVVLDFSQIRPAGTRLRGYGWISSGDEQIATAFKAICELMSRRADQLLTRIDMLDIENWMGTILSSRRCLPKGTLVHTEQGIIPIEEVEIGMRVKALDGNFYSVTNKFYQGVQSLYKISTRFGSLRSTGNHRWAVVKNGNIEWVQTSELQVGDKLVLVPGELKTVRPENLSVPGFPDVPLDGPMAEFLGYIQTHPQVDVHKNLVFCPELRVPIVSRFSALLPQANRLSGGKAYSALGGVIIKDPDVCYNIERYLVPTYWHSRRIPDAIMRAPVSIRAAYWAGVQTVIRDVGNLFFPKEFKRQLQALIASIGERLYRDIEADWDTYEVRSPYGEAEVLEISYNEEDIAETYDLEVETVHQFVVEFGVLTHNSAEIVLCPYGDPEWEDFALAKRNYWINNPQRGQSNNSLVFYEKPSKAELFGIFSLMQAAGGSEPGLINGASAQKRAPWFSGVNPCAEILLGDKSFCNLVELVLPRFNGDFPALKRAVYLIARANYRQTCVDLRDGILSTSWHELNNFLRLCGVGITGIVQWEYLHRPDMFTKLRKYAQQGAISMAEELGLPKPKNVTCVKPSGTLSKIADCAEGAHKPLGRYIFNTIGFSNYDPLLPLLEAANYRMFPHPYDSSSTLVVFPVEFSNIEFTKIDLADRGEAEINTESAVAQLERYRMLMQYYVDQNCSITVSYSPDEVPEIVNWLYDHWDEYVGVSFLYRTDPTKTPEDLGYPYLPQQVVTKDEYYKYTSTLKPFSIDRNNAEGIFDIDESSCIMGACPIK